MNLEPRLRIAMQSPEAMAEREADLNRAIQEFKAQRELFLNALMLAMGLSKHERSARWELVPPAIQKAMVGQPLGRGYYGGFGIGKTFAIAARLRGRAEEAVDDHMAAMVEKGSPQELWEAVRCGRLWISCAPLWCNWHGEAPARRARLLKHGDEIEAWIQSLTDPSRLVILDDIGADRAVGQDWAGEALGRVIDARLRNDGPTAWTSNLGPLALAERYGARTVSRLQALAPGIELPKLPDLRLKPKK